ncbi:multiple epidermal growth factor-like domains protein 6 [Haliotis rufescens]|uniref:multiple epidermal growth factor-like domains protein 6 n=1 Tax=Haliotis rufescens TaxID=6454 RepID=UPI00201EFBB7|nr:multiple epidermal growth factor-like domains protein 6 [Haliotis rufescens]
MYLLRIWIYIAFTITFNTGIYIGEKCTDPICTTITTATTACSTVNNCLLGSCTVNTEGDIGCKDGCKDGFSGRLCTIPCISNCLKCSKRDASNCIECKERHVGEYCENECPNTCPEGCYRNGVCKKQCSDNQVPRCRLCNVTSGICQKCDIHYIGENCETDCTNCVGKCLISGCVEGCINGFHGNKCDTPCSENCFPFCQPDMSAKGKCTPVCDQDTGSCANGCTNGFKGQQCTDGCSSRCKGMRCNQTTGHCMACIEGYYKETCHLRCYNCKHDLCDMKTGFCFECKDGYYGVHCKQTCTNCQSGLCERNGGHCIDVLQVTTVDASKVPSPQSTMYPLVIGFIVFGGIAAILICILSHRVCKLSTRARENPGQSADNVPLQYRRNSYNEIYEEDMDPSAGQRPRAYYSPLVRQDSDLTINNISLSNMSSSDNDSLIIPPWFARLGHDITPESSYN